MNKTYTLELWPDSQQFIGRPGCILVKPSTGNELILDSAYLVPDATPDKHAGYIRIGWPGSQDWDVFKEVLHDYDTPDAFVPVHILKKALQAIIPEAIKVITVETDGSETLIEWSMADCLKPTRRATTTFFEENGMHGYKTNYGWGDNHRDYKQGTTADYFVKKPSLPATTNNAMDFLYDTAVNTLHLPGNNITFVQHYGGITKKKKDKNF